MRLPVSPATRSNWYFGTSEQYDTPIRIAMPAAHALAILTEFPQIEELHQSLVAAYGDTSGAAA